MFLVWQCNNDPINEIKREERKTEGGKLNSFIAKGTL
jgi:hypothetical protein